MQFVSNSMMKILYSESMMSAAASKNAAAVGGSFGSIYAEKAEWNDSRADIQYSDSETAAQRAKNNAINRIAKADRDISSVLRVGTEAPEEVKIAWIEASREVGWNGLGDTEDHGFRGLLAGQLGCNHSNSVDGTENILGNSIESAMAVISAARYQRDNPGTGEWTIDPSEWVNEKRFYDAFLDKLEKLRTGEINYEGRSAFGEFASRNPVTPQEESKSISELQYRDLGSRVIDSAKRIDANGTEYEMTAAYSAESTPQNPVVEVKLRYGDEEKLYRVNINDVDIKNGSQVEQFALMSYAGDTEGIVHRYPPKGSNVSDVIFKPNLYLMLSKYGLSQIPWEKNHMDLDIFAIWENRKYHRQTI